MVTLEEARRFLGVDGHAEDEEIARLLQVAREYLGRIGVAVADPVPTPVRQASLLLVAQFRRDMTIRSEQVEGVGGTAYNAPTVTNEATDNLVRLLTAPYREVQL